jgi:hypothetical protein
MSDRRAYQFAFRVGIVGTLLLAIYTVFGNTLAGLSALAVWTLAILFVLPWFYLFYEDRVGDIPDWAIRGPHQ